MNKYNETKNFLKHKAFEIRTMKLAISKGFREGKSAGLQWSLVLEQRMYRKLHIAMSLARGKTMLQIEQKVREDNKLSEKDLLEIEGHKAAILASWEAQIKAREEAQNGTH